MTSQKKRIIAGCIVGIAVVTAFLLLLDMTPLVICAYVFLLMDVLLAGGALWQLSNAGRKGYITGVVFPMALRPYLIFSLSLAVVMVSLEIGKVWTMPWTWYAAIQILALGFTAWKLLAIGAGHDEIHRVGEEVRAKVVSWKLLQADAEAILKETPEGLKSDISAVCDAIRHADPMSMPETASIEDGISRNVGELKSLVLEGKTDEAKALCTKIRNAIRDRANRLKILK